MHNSNTKSRYLHLLHGIIFRLKEVLCKVPTNRLFRFASKELEPSSESFQLPQRLYIAVPAILFFAYRCNIKVNWHDCNDAIFSSPREVWKLKISPFYRKRLSFTRFHLALNENSHLNNSLHSTWQTLSHKNKQVLLSVIHVLQLKVKTKQ